MNLHQPWLKLLLASCTTVVYCGCLTTPMDTSPMTLTEIDPALVYLPLGDSYTIGEGVAIAERWPNQLVNRLAAENIQLTIAENPARTGYTTQHLINQELPLVQTYQPDVVTLQIGVNDWVQGVSADTFANNYQTILETILKTVPANQVLIVTIPDYTVTPTGKTFGDADTNRAGLIAFNQIITALADQYQVSVVDVFAVSQAMQQDTTLVVRDGLHPSAKEYAVWVDQILPIARQQLGT